MDLGGGRGKNTAIARLELGDGEADLTVAEATVRQGHRGTGNHEGDALFRDEVLVEYLRRWTDEDTVVAINAPLTLPPCVRCTLSCPGLKACDVPSVVWMRTWALLLLPRGKSDSSIQASRQPRRLDEGTLRASERQRARTTRITRRIFYRRPLFWFSQWAPRRGNCTRGGGGRLALSQCEYWPGIQVVVRRCILDDAQPDALVFNVENGFLGEVPACLWSVSATSDEQPLSYSAKVSLQ